MNNTQIIATDTWTVSLPGDWIQKESPQDGQLYFESADESKAISIATWELGNDDASRSPRDLAESFKRVDVRALGSMDGYSWRLVDELATHTEGGADVLIDHLAPAHSYRILTKILARPPIVVRAAFHDYLCEDYDSSRDFFAPIVQSLSFREAVEQP
jgi:hypothetical protein